jgi:hypothetical protein
MSKKISRAGGKYTGNHTTLIPLAALVCDIAEACPAVTKISPGFIRAGLGSTGARRVKIQELNGYLLLSARDTSAHQEIHIYASSSAEAILAIAEGLKAEKIAVVFPKGTPPI